MLDIFTHAKCSFLIVQTTAQSNMFMSITYWLGLVSLVSIYQIFINYMLDVIVIPFKSMWCAWLRWVWGCFFERLSDGFYYGYSTFSPAYPLFLRPPYRPPKKITRPSCQGVGLYFKKWGGMRTLVSVLVYRLQR
jgi:hypothetical protein